MAISTTSVLPEEHHFYPDSAINTPYAGEADAGEFFSTLLDIINPLQHIPLVSTLYREITGDEINPAARMVGGAVFGGPVGFASASANVLLQQASGEDVVGHALSLFSDDQTDPLNGSDLADQTANIGPTSGHTEQKTTNKAPGTPDIEDIVWNTTRVIPTLTAKHNIEEKQLVTENSSSLENGITPAREQKIQAPAWLDKSREVAHLDEAARSAGALSQTRTAQPWVANAMFDALDKYEALARARAQTNRADPGS